MRKLVQKHDIARGLSNLYLLARMANDERAVIGKRGRMRLAALCLFALSFQSGTAQAAETTVGVAAPLTGSSAILGAQLRDGASAAADAMHGKNTIRLEIVDDACTAEGGAEAARKFAAMKAQVVIGFLCTESIEAAMPILKEAGIPVITIGVRADSLTDRREKTGWPVFRMAPRADGERTAAAQLLVPLWRTELFAIVDDGTIYGRELAESFRLAAEQAALKPVFVDTFRPELDNQIALAGRLRKAGATHVFVGGDRDDIAILGRDAKGLGMNLTIAGGEAMQASPGQVPLQRGTLMIGLPDWTTVATPESVASLKAHEIEPEGYVLPGYAAVGIAAAATSEAEAAGKRPVDILNDHEFQTPIGTIRFDAKGDLAQNPYRLFRYDGVKFVEVK
jgi:branched-chain amino acid transport system substrate-binding protein